MGVVGVVVVKFNVGDFVGLAADLGKAVRDKIIITFEVVGADNFFHHGSTVFGAGDGDGVCLDAASADGAPIAEESGGVEWFVVGDMFCLESFKSGVGFYVVVKVGFDGRAPN